MGKAVLSILFFAVFSLMTSPGLQGTGFVDDVFAQAGGPPQAGEPPSQDQQSQEDAREAAEEDAREAAEEDAREAAEEDAREAAEEDAREAAEEDAREAAEEDAREAAEEDAREAAEEDAREAAEEDASLVTICHIPPGNPSAAKTIMIGESALEAHLNHGDIEGACDENSEQVEALVGGLEITNKMKQRGMAIAQQMREQGMNMSEQMKQKGTEIAERMKQKGLDLSELQNTTSDQPVFAMDIGSDMSQQGLDISENLAIIGLNIGNTMSQREVVAESKAEIAIEKMQKRIAQLESRLQSLVSQLQQGDYHLPDEIEPDSQSSAFNVAFEGQTDTAEPVAGSIFLENVATRADAAKFKVTGGEVVVGDSFPYDVVFGKARVVETPANDVLTIIAQLVDENGDVRTAKLVMDSANLKDEILSGSAGFDIVSSKVPGFDIASGSGTVSLVGA